MHQRCNAGPSQAKTFPYYKGRGIAVCSRWHTFDHFVADMGEQPAGTTLDRIDNDRGYEPGNCRWATPAQQQANTRKTRFIQLSGERLTVREWAGRVGIHPQTISDRIRRGWPIADAVSRSAIPPNQRASLRKA